MTRMMASMTCRYSSHQDEQASHPRSPKVWHAILPEKPTRSCARMRLSGSDRTSTRSSSGIRVKPASRDPGTPLACGFPVHTFAERNGRELLIRRLLLVQIGGQEAYDVVVAQRFRPGNKRPVAGDLVVP